MPKCNSEYIYALVLTYFLLTKGRVTFFRLETIVASFLHHMVLFSKWFSTMLQNASLWCSFLIFHMITGGCCFYFLNIVKYWKTLFYWPWCVIAIFFIYYQISFSIKLITRFHQLLSTIVWKLKNSGIWIEMTELINNQSLNGVIPSKVVKFMMVCIGS